MMIAFRAKREATRKFLLFLFQGLTYFSFLLNTRAIDAEESVFKKHWIFEWFNKNFFEQKTGKK